MGTKAEKYSKTALKILLATQELVQRVGFNGFSYADISMVLGIKNASIHYHFPTKGDLMIALVQMYREDFITRLNSFEDGEMQFLDKLEHFIALYRSTLEQDSKLCLCSILSAEVETLPEGVREEINLFFADIEQWLTNLFGYGVEQGELSLPIKPEVEAKLMLAVIKGAQLLARSYGSMEQFDLITQNMIEHYKDKK